MQRETYDVLLLDIGMPERSGIDLADRLNKQPHPTPAIIFVTAHNQHANTAFDNHAVEYLLKPFSIDRINEELNVAFRRAQNDRAALLLKTLPHLETLFARPSIKATGRRLFIHPSEVAVIALKATMLC